MTREVTSADLARADRKASQRAVASKLPVGAPAVMPEDYPDRNPAWDRKADWGTTRAPDGARLALTKVMDRGPEKVGSTLDLWILELRIGGARFDDIASKIGPPYTGEWVANRVTELLAKHEKHTEAHAKALHLARLDALLNACWSRVLDGSIEHMDIAVKILERLAKAQELEKENNKVELHFVDEATEQLLTRMVDMVASNMRRMYESILKANKIMPPDPEIIDGTIADALDESQEIMRAAAEIPLILERKGGEMQLVKQSEAR